ncbi:hypothetical protein D3C75_993790 [compost metagenome]
MAIRGNQTGFNARIKTVLVLCGRFIIVQQLYIFRFGKGLQGLPVGEINIRHIPCGSISLELLVTILYRGIQLDLDIRHFLLQFFHCIVEGAFCIFVKVLGVDLQLDLAGVRCRRRILIFVRGCVAAATGRQHQHHGKRYH